ncbi:hypothetical protein pipiens_006609 [Culex pipiens pipiens]|uniref:39S ribosomal protein L9, mitochondrial n=1 Tax=Culex pipiens pipiens TaxID=38569 RepID=A0ABD1DNT6_CULPP
MLVNLTKAFSGVSLCTTTRILNQQSRNTFILKRHSSKAGQKAREGAQAARPPLPVARYAVERDAAAEQEQHSSAYAQRTVNKLEQLTLAVVMNKDHPWVIERWHIGASLRKAGFYVPNEAITLPDAPIEGPDLLKQNKEFFCTVTINNLEQAKLRCRIHHWSTEPSERLPYVFEHWKNQAEPLFGDDSAPVPKQQ